jgi:hypothetical protein
VHRRLTSSVAGPCLGCPRRRARSDSAIRRTAIAQARTATPAGLSLTSIGRRTERGYSAFGIAADPAGSVRSSVALRSRSFLDSGARDCSDRQLLVVTHEVPIIVFRDPLQRLDETALRAHPPGRRHAPSDTASFQPSRWWMPSSMSHGRVEASTRWSKGRNG